MCPKICIKYRKHWKSYLSFQLSADWDDLGSKQFPSKGQFFISISNNIPKLEKLGVTVETIGVN